MNALPIIQYEHVKKTREFAAQGKQERERHTFFREKPAEYEKADAGKPKPIRRLPDWNRSVFTIEDENAMT